MDGRDFGYLECGSAEEFKSIFPKIALLGESALPESGGMINEDFSVTTPDGVKLFALSYKGDIDGWRRKLREAASVLGVRWAELSEDTIRLEDGREFALSACTTEDYLRYS